MAWVLVVTDAATGEEWPVFGLLPPDVYSTGSPFEVSDMPRPPPVEPPTQEYTDPSQIAAREAMAAAAVAVPMTPVPQAEIRRTEIQAPAPWAPLPCWLFASAEPRDAALAVLSAMGHEVRSVEVP